MKLPFALAIATHLLPFSYGYSHQSKHKSTRRAFLSWQATLLPTVATAISVGTPSIAHAGLLEEFGTDPTKIGPSNQSSTERSTAAAAPVRATNKEQSGIEPNLRSNYYYPTNKVRYLPRIKKCADQIPMAASMIGSGDWAGANEFATRVADDTILPLKLYTSSLTGGGTNVKVSYTKELFQAADVFERNQKKLVKAISKRDTEESSQALQTMAEALTTYRTVARLQDDMGDIPSVDDIRRAASRTQKGFEKLIK